MERLRKKIRDSFFNPPLYFLPLLLFLVVDDLFYADMAWRISFLMAGLLLIHIFFVNKRLFWWNIIFIGVFLLISIISNFIKAISSIPTVSHISFEITTIGFILIYLVFRKKLEKWLLQSISRLIPMSNNFNELRVFLLKLLFVIGIYIIGVFSLFYADLSVSPYEKMLHYTYIGLLLFLVIHESLRVQIIRAKLVKEEWWPIINQQGKIVGSIEHLTSLDDTKKYMHPIARVLLIDKGMVLLQKRPESSHIFPGLWDAAISNHVQMNETVDNCVERTAKERYSFENFRYMHLANYMIEQDREIQYVFLFISCLQSEISKVTPMTPLVKWWTQQQIETELHTGIFSPNFQKEYDLLKRSGLLETGRCECNCRLKQAIYTESFIVKDDTSDVKNK